jgi:hypothetical protein
MREILADSISLALAIILLFHLIMILIFHSVLIYENNEWILIAELVLAIWIIALNIDRIVDDIKTLRGKV